ncbi:MAG: ABC transporter substrate-binding protein [Pseudomonadota bacterium]
MVWHTGNGIASANLIRQEIALFLGGCLLILLALLPPVAAAANILIVANVQDEAHAELIENLRTALSRDSNNRFNVRTIPLSSLENATQEEQNIPRGDLIVTIGTVAAQKIAQLKVSAQTPVLSILVPKANIDDIIRGRSGAANSGQQHSAVYLDQPLPRQLELVRLALPGYDEIGALFGPTSRMLLPELENAAANKKLRLRERIVRKSDTLATALTELLTESNVLLAVPDPLIFNPYTVQNVLLTTYRQKIPVIGFSLAYAKAGALMAVYSSPAQIAQQTAEIIILAAARNWQLPPPQYPRYFNIAVNRQVARSLGLEIPDESSLQRRLRQAEDGSS